MEKESGSKFSNYCGANINGYLIQNQIGSGTYGVVLKGVALVKKNIDVAIKITKKPIKEMDKKLQSLMQAEISLLQRCNGCQNIIQYIDSFEYDGHQFIVMEFCQYGTLQEMCQNNPHPFP